MCWFAQVSQPATRTRARGSNIAREDNIEEDGDIGSNSNIELDSNIEPGGLLA
jgi:hypothetical protein